MGKVNKKQQKLLNKNQIKPVSKPQIKNKTKFKKDSKKNIEKVIKSEKLKQVVADVGQADAVKKHDPAEIEQTIFVGNIPPNTKKIQLKKLFSQFGVVKTIRFRTSDGKKIFKHKMRKDTESLIAYVVMENKESIEKALTLTGTEFKGNHIRVTKATQSTEEIDSKRVLFVGNLKYSATDEKLYEIFSSCGEVEYVRTIRNNKGCKGVAYVCFKKPESISLGLELNNTMLDDRPIRVKKYSKNELGTNERLKANDQQITGSARRIIEKEIKKLRGAAKNEKKPLKLGNKKSEFRGIQITKKQKSKKKKKSTSMNIMAKKIAPKTQLTTS